MSGYEVLCGDCREVLPTLPTGSAHCCITSPPYWGLRDYGVAGQIGREATPERYVATLIDIFRQVRRVLRDDGTLWLNLGDCYAGYWGAKYAHKPFGADRTADASTPPNKPSFPFHAGSIKPKDLLGLPWRVAFALQEDGWYLRTDIVWCLSGGTVVYARTPRGEKPMVIKDLVRMTPEDVQLWNGTRWTQVLGWSQHAGDGALEIELRSGERIGCLPGHRWPTERGVVRADELRVGDVIPHCQLPDAMPSSAPSCLPDDVGWLVGMYLANGTISGKTIQIASHSKHTQRYERLSEIAARYGGTCHWYQLDGNSVTIALSGAMVVAILAMYIGGSHADKKHLHPRCWQRSTAFLRHVLDGYLEGDGHWEDSKQRWQIGFTRNEALAQDIRTLCARFGATLVLRPTTAQYGERSYAAYRGEIRFERSGHPNEQPMGKVVAIRHSRARVCWDIGVADPPHLFALASGLLTHNSKPNCLPESVKDRPTRSHEFLFLLTKQRRYFYDADAIMEPLQPGSLRRYTSGLHSPYGDAQAHGGKHSHHMANADCMGAYMNAAGRNRRTVWHIPTKPFRGAHFAVFPPALVEPCLLAGTSAHGVCPVCGAPWARIVERQSTAAHDGASDTAYAGGSTANRLAMLRQAARARGEEYVNRRVTVGWQPTCACDNNLPVPATVLDPFAGAGTTGLVAVAHGRRFLGVELNAEYCALARERAAREGSHA